MTAQDSQTTGQGSKPIWRLPVLLMAAVSLVLVMLRLGVWQLDRAAEKQHILTAQQARSVQPPGMLQTLNTQLENASDPRLVLSDLRFRNVRMTGQLLAEHTLYVDRQVWQSQVGYLVITPMRVQGVDALVPIARGWVAAGSDRSVLPTVETPDQTVTVEGRLNLLPAKPPLWDDAYPASKGPLWQFVETERLTNEIGSPVFPLMVELAPVTPAPIGLSANWAPIDDKWVAKHHAYAFQWFAMAGAFIVACVVLLLRRGRQYK